MAVLHRFCRDKAHIALSTQVLLYVKYILSLQQAQNTVHGIPELIYPQRNKDHCVRLSQEYLIIFRPSGDVVFNPAGTITSIHGLGSSVVLVWQ